MSVRPRARPLLLLAGMLASAVAVAQPVLLSKDEFLREIVGKSMYVASTANSQNFLLELQDGGKAIVSRSYNDIGTWRMADDTGGYCVTWNKLAPAERCNKMARRDGKLVAMDAAGKEVTATVEVR